MIFLLVSIIIPVKNEGVNVKNTLDSAFKVNTNYPFEIIVVDDNSDDGCCEFIQDSPLVKVIRTQGVGAARARNIGAHASKGNYLIFCDGHLFFEDYWIDNILSPIIEGWAHAVAPGIASTHSPSAIGFGQTLNQDLSIRWLGWQKEPFPAPIIPGGCFAIDRNVFFAVGGFDQGFRVWGFEDIELSIKLWLFGYFSIVEPKVKILHLFRERHPYPVSYSHVDYNMLRMAYSHFNEARIEKAKASVKYSSLEDILEQIKNSDTFQQREKYLARRKYSDDWYMERFNIPF